MNLTISSREAPLRRMPRRSYSVVENRHVRIWPSAVRRMREQAPQNISVTGAMMPISPGEPSVNSYFHAVEVPRDVSLRRRGNTLSIAVRSDERGGGKERTARMGVARGAV